MILACMVAIAGDSEHPVVWPLRVGARSPGPTTAGRAFSGRVRTASSTAGSRIGPILTASMLMSALVASSCGERKAAGGTRTAPAPRVFCAVRAVTAAVP